MTLSLLLNLVNKESESNKFGKDRHQCQSIESYTDLNRHTIPPTSKVSSLHDADKVSVHRGLY